MAFHLHAGRSYPIQHSGEGKRHLRSGSFSNPIVCMNEHQRLFYLELLCDLKPNDRLHRAALTYALISFDQFNKEDAGPLSSFKKQIKMGKWSIDQELVHTILKAPNGHDLRMNLLMSALGSQLSPAQFVACIKKVVAQADGDHELQILSDIVSNWCFTHQSAQATKGMRPVMVMLLTSADVKTKAFALTGIAALPSPPAEFVQALASGLSRSNLIPNRKRYLLLLQGITALQIFLEKRHSIPRALKEEFRRLKVSEKLIKIGTQPTCFNQVVGLRKKLERLLK